MQATTWGIQLKSVRICIRWLNPTERLHIIAGNANLLGVAKCQGNILLKKPEI
jgi:hypothetical protein